MGFRRCSHLHLPRLHSKPEVNPGFRRRSHLRHLLACKSELEVDLYGVLTPLTPPPPPSHARLSRRWTIVPFLD